MNLWLNRSDCYLPDHHDIFPRTRVWYVVKRNNIGWSKLIFPVKREDSFDWCILSKGRWHPRHRCRNQRVLCTISTFPVRGQKIKEDKQEQDHDLWSSTDCYHKRDQIGTNETMTGKKIRRVASHKIIPTAMLREFRSKFLRRAIGL